jgi:hypothetical protein
MDCTYGPKRLPVAVLECDGRVVTVTIAASCWSPGVMSIAAGRGRCQFVVICNYTAERFVTTRGSKDRSQTAHVLYL